MRLFLRTMLSLVTLSGFAQTPKLSVSAANINAQVAAGASTTQTFTITNTGNRDLNWTMNLQGNPVEFEKQAYADWTQAANQDRITPNVWITRKSTQGLFNIFNESGFASSSPAGTEWAFGKSEDLSSGDYAAWQTAVDFDPQSMIDNVISMHAITDDRYFDITFHSFLGNNTGGGFSYTRVEHGLKWASADFTSGTLLPGQSKTITLTLNSTTLFAGLSAGQIVIESNDPQNEEKMVPLSLNVGTGAGAPEISTPAAKNLGQGYAGFSTRSIITINNTGSAILNVTNVTSDNSAFVPEALVFSIQPGQGFDLPINFMPANPGAIAGTLTITNNDADESSLNIALSATALAPPLSAVNQNSFTINAASDANESANLVLSNTTGTDLTYSLALIFPSATPTVFSKTNFADPLIPENQDWVSTDIHITRSDRQGLFNGAVETGYVNGTSPANTLWANVSTAEAREQGISYTDWRNAIGGDPYEYIGKPWSMYIPSEDRFFDIVPSVWTCCENGGGFSYTRTEIYNWLTADTDGGAIVAGTDNTIGLSFNTAGLAAGTYTATVRITSNDPAAPVRNIPVTFNISGTPDATMFESTVEFDDTSLGHTSKKKIHVINNGAAPLNITGVTYSDAEFMTYQATGTVPPFSYGAIEISFTPSAIESYSGTITVATNDANNPTLEIPYSANGVGAAEIDVTTDVMDATVSTGDFITKTITIENTGVGPLHWSAKIENNNSLVSFIKPDHADWKLAENQDRITPNVWITRQDNQGLFNIARESKYFHDLSPIGTEWQLGSTLSVDPSNYMSWEDAVDGWPPSSVGRTFSLHTAREYYDVTFTSWTQDDNGGGFSYERRKANGWLKLDATEGTLAPGASTVVTVTYDPTDYLAGIKNDVVYIVSDDVDEPSVAVPIQMTIEGVAEIEASLSAAAFGNIGIGRTKTIPVTLSNNGTVPLVISSIVSTNAAFTVTQGAVTIAPDESVTVNITFSATAVQAYTGDLEITSNAENESGLIITLTGTGIQIPDIAVTPAKIAELTPSTTLFEGDITIENSGSADLNWSTNRPSSFPLSDILNNLNDGYTAITNIIPSMYTFNYDGGSNSISDGGNDMYDNGNFLNTDISPSIQYSDNVVIDGSAVFGAGTTYFTRHLNGLFVLAADLNGVNSFFISGNNGADGGGSVDATTLTTTVSGTSYTAFLKRVYNTSDPSINQMVIIESDASAGQTWSTNSDYSEHVINGLGNVTRIYYILYAGSSGTYIGDTDAQAIFEQFINTISGGNGFLPDWITLDTYSGTVAPGATQTVHYTIDLSTYPEANYEGNITISSNDPDESKVQIPVQINIGAVIVVNEIADVMVNEGFGSKTVDFANVFLDGNGGALTYAVGTDVDIISGAINGTQLTLSETGTGTSIVSIRAEDPDGNVVYEDFNFRVNDVPSVVTPIADKTLVRGFNTNSTDITDLFEDKDANDVVTLSATSSNEAVVTVAIVDNALVLTDVAVGTTTITITANDGNTGIASTTFNVTVNKAPATVVIANISATYDGNAKSVTTSTTPTNLNVNVVYTQQGTVVASPVNAGSYEVTATINDANYAGTSTATLTIAKADQTITFNAIASVMNSADPFALTATSTSTLAVSFTIVSGPATISGNTLTLTGAVGTVTVKATQAGDANYNAATAVERTFEVTQDPILGVDDVLSASVETWPVPAKDQLNITSGKHVMHHVTFSNLQGVRLVNVAPQASEYTLPLGHYPQGIYLLIITTDIGVVTRKIEIVK